MTKEQEFKARLISVLTELNENGVKDPQAMSMVGSLASDLATTLEQPTWVAAKQALSAAAYDALLATFDKRGNAYYRDGHVKHAYAIQLLAVSLVARTQRADADIAAGEKLIDQIIDRALTLHRQNQPVAN